MSWIKEIGENNTARKLKPLHGRIINKTILLKNRSFLANF